jgi:hypothetical protein
MWNETSACAWKTARGGEGGYRRWPWRRFGLMLRSIAAKLQRQRTKYSRAAMRLEA